MSGIDNLRPVPFEPGNQVARRHGFYVEQLSPAEDEDVQTIADAIRELSPVDAEALEPLVQGLAGKMWRRKRAYADLIANGVVRRNGKAAPILRDLETLENSIRRDLEALALTPQAAADLGLTLAKTRSADRFNLEALDPEERASLERLLTKARSNG
jgi:hypothetical protein